MSADLPEWFQEAFPQDAYKSVTATSTSAADLVYEPPNLGTGVTQADTTVTLRRPFLLTWLRLLDVSSAGQTPTRVDLYDSTDLDVATNGRLIGSFPLNPGGNWSMPQGETHLIQHKLFAILDATGTVRVMAGGRAPS